MRLGYDRQPGGAKHSRALSTDAAAECVPSLQMFQANQNFSARGPNQPALTQAKMCERTGGAVSKLVIFGAGFDMARARDGQRRGMVESGGEPTACRAVEGLAGACRYSVSNGTYLPVEGRRSHRGRCRAARRMPRLAGAQTRWCVPWPLAPSQTARQSTSAWASLRSAAEGIPSPGIGRPLDMMAVDRWFLAVLRSVCRLA